VPACCVEPLVGPFIHAFLPLDLGRPPAERSSLIEVFQTVIVTLRRSLACRCPELIELCGLF
jgi:hypothetical protein